MNRRIRRKLSEVCQPVSRAKGLPNEYYTCEKVFQTEKEILLFNNWTGIGFEKDIPKPGDVFPITFFNMPLLLVRDEKHNIRVFQNTCRHRGMILVERKKKLHGLIRCPYHSWCYSLDGSLKSTPHVAGPGYNIHPDIKRSELGLFEIKSFVWNGVIFANISGNAPNFDKINGPLIRRWKEFNQPLFHSGRDSSIELTINANWKLAVENYCESYHLPWVHPDLNSYSKLEDHYNIEQRGLFSGQGSHFYQQLRDENGKVFLDFTNLNEKWFKSAEYISVFPNVLLGVHRDHTFAIILFPITANKTTERIEIYYPAKNSLGQDFAKLRVKNRDQWKKVFEEDIFVVEGMQRGRSGILFDGGKFSPVMDSANHLFHEWVAMKFSKT